jgi:MoaA/NifB/PqqE/SkfB family radical SAM enzyme
MEKNCCEKIYYCRGCRAIAYSVTGNYLSRDSMCFKEFVNEN